MQDFFHPRYLQPIVVTWCRPRSHRARSQAPARSRFRSSSCFRSRNSSWQLDRGKIILQAAIMVFIMVIIMVIIMAIIMVIIWWLYGDYMVIIYEYMIIHGDYHVDYVYIYICVCDSWQLVTVVSLKRFIAVGDYWKVSSRTFFLMHHSGYFSHAWHISCIYNHHIIMYNNHIITMIIMYWNIYLEGPIENYHLITSTWWDSETWDSMWHGPP